MGVQVYVWHKYVRVFFPILCVREGKRHRKEEWNTKAGLTPAPLNTKWQFVLIDYVSQRTSRDLSSVLDISPSPTGNNLKSESTISDKRMVFRYQKEVNRKRGIQRCQWSKIMILIIIAKQINNKRSRVSLKIGHLMFGTFSSFAVGGVQLSVISVTEALPAYL